MTASQLTGRDTANHNLLSTDFEGIAIAMSVRVGSTSRQSGLERLAASGGVPEVDEANLVGGATRQPADV